MRRRPSPQLNNLWISRKHVGLGQKSVARLLGHKSISVISEYETGKLLPSLSSALKLAVVYNRPITELYPDLYRQIQEEVEVAQAKGPVTNRACVSAPHI
jgi:transcriptional regulator with XRE-family HTH domain